MIKDEVIIKILDKASDIILTEQIKKLELILEEEFHKRKLYDRYKRIFAKSQGYYYLEIPYWTDDKNETWKKLINDKINEIYSSLLETTEIYADLDDSAVQYSYRKHLI